MPMNHSLSLGYRLSFALLLAGLSLACGAQRHNTVRFVTATPADLKTAEQQDEVWYEVQAGDELPLHFVFAGVANGVNEMPLVLKAQKPFYFVSRKDGRFYFSFDGQTIAHEAGKFAITLVPGPPSNKAGILIYLGKPEEMEATLEAVGK